MKHQIIIDGIRVEGEDAKRILDEVLHDVDSKGVARRRFVIGVTTAAIIVSALIAASIGATFPLLFPGIKKVYIAMLSAAAASTSSILWIHWYMRRNKRRFREAMRRRGFELCPECGYWLKGLGDDSTRCPECGSPRTEMPTA